MSGTKKLERFELPSRTAPTTPVAEISADMLAKARKSVVPVPEPAAEPVAEPARDEPRDRESIERLRTRLARKFTTLADEVTECFENFPIGEGEWIGELTAPEGMSTHGGKQATQHFRLQPRRPEHPVLVAGLVDPVAETAALRDYDHMCMLHKARFGKPLPITGDEWEQFLDRAEVVLRMANIEPSRVPAPPAIRTPFRNRRVALVALGVIVPLALLVGWRVLVVLLR